MDPFYFTESTVRPNLTHRTVKHFTNPTPIKLICRCTQQMGIYTVNLKNTPKCFCHIFQKLSWFWKNWYTLSWTNLRYSNLSVVQLTRIVSLHYLVKLSVRVLQVNSNWICNPNPKTHQKFLSHSLQNSDKILQLLYWIYLPQSVITVFHLT